MCQLKKMVACNRSVENMDQYQPQVGFRKFQSSQALLFRASRNLSRGFLTISIFYCALSWEATVCYSFSKKASDRRIQTRYNSEKCKQYEICFAGKTPLFPRDFQTLNARAARAALSLNIHQFFRPKSSCLMHETDVKRISFFLEFLMLYEVYCVVIFFGKSRL